MSPASLRRAAPEGRGRHRAVRRAFGVVAGVGLVVVAIVAPLRAHEAPSRVEIRQGRTLRVEIAVYDEQPYVRRPVRFTVRALPGGRPVRCADVTARGHPFVETRAVATRVVRLRPDADVAGRCSGQVLLPVQGLWDLEVRIAAAAEELVVRVPLTVAAPQAVLKWIAWIIALAPLGVMAAFAGWQRRYLRRLQAEAAPVPAD